jgi:hypothetical protein
MLLFVPLAVEPEALIEPIEPMPDDELLPALLVPPTAPVLDVVAPPVLLPVELGWSLPWLSGLLLFRLPGPVLLPRLPAPLARSRAQAAAFCFARLLIIHDEFLL